MALADYLKADRIIKLPWYQKALALLAIVVLIVVIYFITVDRSYRNQIADLKNQIVRLNTQIANLRAIEQDLSKFERQNALLKKELDKAMTKLPNNPQIDQLIKELTFRARKYGIEISRIDIRKEKVQPLYIEVPLKLNLSGDYFPLMIFLNELARLERIVNISDLQIKTGKGNLLKVECILIAYRFKQMTQPQGKKKKK